MASRARSTRAKDTASTHVEVRKAYKMYVGGEFVRSESGRSSQLPGDSPSGTQDNIPVASRKDLRDAVTSARAAWNGWSTRSAANRGQVVYRLSEMLHARRSELAERLRCGGATEREARRETDATIDRVVAFAGWADKYQSLFTSLNPVAGPHFTFTVPESMGVVAIVAPARPALLGLAGAILPVIVSGNTCVVLASADDPRAALTFAEALATSDMPGGVVNILTGEAAELLPHAAKHMEIAALDLHGVDDALAKSAAQLAATSVKRVHTRALDARAWYGDDAESPRWIERFVELKTIWHPRGT